MDDRFPTSPPTPAPHVRIVAIAPTFNNGATLRAVLDGLTERRLPVIVVNDGATDETENVLADWMRSGLAGERAVVHHPGNRGKAAAMQTGFARAAELGFTHALTIDTDGQHDPLDAARLRDMCLVSSDAIIVGERPCGADYPLRSRLGRAVSNALLAVESGAHVGDSQCGLRVYPLEVVRALQTSAGGYAYETEILVRAAWANVPIVSTPIRCIYDPHGGRVTHFRLLRDSAAAAAMHFRLLHRSAFPWPVRKLRSGDSSTNTGTLFERGRRWLNPLRLWRSLRLDPRERERIGASMGWGLFIGTQPPLGYKGALCLLVAKVFRLQPLIVLATSSLSTPPLGFILWGSAIIVGHVILHGTLPAAAQYDLAARGVMPVLRAVAVEWVVGGLVFGSALGIFTWLAANAIVRLLNPRRDAVARPGQHSSVKVSRPACAQSMPSSAGSAPRAKQR